MLKLKEVHIAHLWESDDIENYLTTFERVAKRKRNSLMVMLI